MNPRAARVLLIAGCLSLGCGLAAGCEGDPPRHAAYGGGGAGGEGGLAAGGAPQLATNAGEPNAAGVPGSPAAAGAGGAPPVDMIPEQGGLASTAGQPGEPSAGTGSEPTAGAPALGACDGELTFPDPYFEQQVRNNLDLPSGPPITAGDVANLTEFTLVGPDGAVDITGIECLRALTSVNFADNSVGEPLSLLAELPNLTTLDLSDDYLDDISELATLTQLRSLNLRGNDITDISPLTDLVNLEVLDLYGNGGFSFVTTDISPLAGMTKLKSLLLDRLIIDDLSPLSSLGELEQLSLGGVTITDASPLADLTTLTSLNLRSTMLSDLSDLSTLTKLTTLDVSSNQLTDVTVLGNLPDIAQLSISYNPAITTLAPLVSSSNVGAGVDLSAEGLNCTTFAADFAALLAKSVTLHTSC
jgi:internalin A